MNSKNYAYKHQFHPELDSFRCFGIALVLATHMRLTSFGWIAMEMFFVLSGFLITKSLVGLKEAPNQKKARFFFRRRIARIFPLYFGFLIVVYCLNLGFSITPDLRSQLPYLSTFSFNFMMYPNHETNEWYSHLWSISLEEQFYLVWGLFLLFLPFSFCRFIAISVIFIAPIARWWLHKKAVALGFNLYDVGRITYFHTLAQMDSFMIGAATATFWQENLNKNFKKYLVIICFLIVSGALYNILTIKHIPWQHHLGYPFVFSGNFTHIWSYTLFNVFFALSIVFFTSRTTKNEHRIKAIFRIPLIVKIGQASFSMYVFHWVLLEPCKQFYLSITSVLPSGMAKILNFEGFIFVFYLIIVSCIGIFSYKFIEIPAKRLIISNSKNKSLFNNLSSAEEGFKT